MLQPVRGTHDLLPEECRRYRKITEGARAIAACYGYEEIATPIFEFSTLFHRLGETSDIVTKETYTFEDRGGTEITLRPEGTAPVARAVLSNGLTQQIPLKFCYAGPMFRYDRPQKGRFRQFETFGVELFGVAEPLGDVEAIALAAQILESFGILGKVTLQLNTLGDKQSRDNYRDALIEYFSDHYEALSQESRERLARNPLRILDSKEKQDRALIHHAPFYADSLTPEAADFFANVCEGLDQLGIAYNRNQRLVRGLDYYCHTAFEFVSNELGSQGTVLAGGRYDGLVEALGGPNIPGIGWGAGVERLALLAILEDTPPRGIAVVPIGEEAEKAALSLTQDLRRARFMIDLGYSGAPGKRLKRANKVNARYAIILGEDELAHASVLVRDLDTGEQEKVIMADVIGFLQGKPVSRF